jgi:DNA-binding CsgD family transcriptional regulator
MLQASREAQYHMGLCRPKRADAFDAVTVLGFDACARHVATALELQHRLGGARRYCAALEQVVDRVADAVILTDAGGVPVFANARADRLLDEADGLSMGVAGLTASNPNATRRLREAIATVAAADSTLVAVNRHGSTGEILRLNLDRPSGRPGLSLALLPVWRLDWISAGAARPRVAIFVTEPDSPPQIDEAGLCEFFGLRRREATVTALLATGLNPAEIAAKLGIGIGTVRNHLKSAFLKTDTHSQPALAALARGFTVPVPRAR